MLLIEQCDKLIKQSKQENKKDEDVLQMLIEAKDRWENAIKDLIQAIERNREKEQENSNVGRLNNDMNKPDVLS